MAILCCLAQKAASGAQHLLSGLKKAGVSEYTYHMIHGRNITHLISGLIWHLRLYFQQDQYMEHNPRETWSERVF
jgi:hypothetical protein